MNIDDTLTPHVQVLAVFLQQHARFSETFSHHSYQQQDQRRSVGRLTRHVIRVLILRQRLLLRPVSGPTRSRRSHGTSNTRGSRHVSGTGKTTSEREWGCFNCFPAQSRHWQRPLFSNVAHQQSRQFHPALSFLSPLSYLLPSPHTRTCFPQTHSRISHSRRKQLPSTATAAWHYERRVAHGEDALFTKCLLACVTVRLSECARVGLCTFAHTRDHRHSVSECTRKKGPGPVHVRVHVWGPDLEGQGHGSSRCQSKCQCTPHQHALLELACHNGVRPGGKTVVAAPRAPHLVSAASHCDTIGIPTVLRQDGSEDIVAHGSREDTLAAWSASSPASADSPVKPVSGGPSCVSPSGSPSMSISGSPGVGSCAPSAVGSFVRSSAGL